MLGDVTAQKLILIAIAFAVIIIREELRTSRPRRGRRRKR